MKKLLHWTPIRFLSDLVEIYFEKRVSRSAAELAYFLILSFFPLLICLNYFVGKLNLDPDTLIQALVPVFPKESLSILTDYLTYISLNQSTTMLVGGLGMAVYSASAAFRALMNIMEDIYDRKSYRGVRQILASVLFSVLLLLTTYVSMVVVLTGEWLMNLASRFRWMAMLELLLNWQWMRFLMLFSLVFLFILLVYRMAAPRGKPRPPVFSGALLASAALVGASALFSWCIGMSSRYSLVYGSLASVIILLVWLYLCGNIIILGNVFNCVWYTHKKKRYLQRAKRGQNG